MHYTQDYMKHARPYMVCHARRTMTYETCYNKETQKQTVSQIDREKENILKKPPLRYKNMMKKYDTAGYGNPETIFGKRVAYGHLQKPASLSITRGYNLKYAETTVCEMASNILSDWNNTKSQKPSGEGGTPDFKWQGWSNGGKNQNPKKSLGLQTKPKKILGPKYNPQKIQCRTSKPQKFPESITDDITITNIQIVLNTPKNPYLNQAAQTEKTCQNFPIPKHPEIVNFKPQKIVRSSHVTRNPEYTRDAWGTSSAGYKRN